MAMVNQISINHIQISNIDLCAERMKWLEGWEGGAGHITISLLIVMMLDDDGDDADCNYGNDGSYDDGDEMLLTCFARVLTL